MAGLRSPYLLEGGEHAPFLPAGNVSEADLPASVPHSPAARSKGQGYIWSGTEWVLEFLVVVPTTTNTALGSGTLAVNTGTKNTALGASVLAANSTGKENTGVGARALNANTIGTGNTALGVNALELNTEGSRNTALGINASLANTTGSENVAVGSGALRENQTGIQNVAIGSNALRLGKASLKSVAVGNAALENNTAESNTAVGNAALKENTTGEFNTGLGATALQKNTSGERNTGAGYEALVENLTGNKNTAVGYAALNENQTGNENTAVGTDALPGKGKVLGSKNTAVGFKAGFENNGEGNVFIGCEAGGKEKAGNNKLFIHNSNTATPLILGDFEAKTLTINGTLGGSEIVGGAQLTKPLAKPAAPEEGGVPTVSAAAPVKKVTALLKGNGVKTSYVITHALKTKFVSVNAYVTTTEEPTEEMITLAGKILITGAEKVEIKFTLAPAAGEVIAAVVMG